MRLPLLHSSKQKRKRKRKPSVDRVERWDNDVTDQIEGKYAQQARQLLNEHGITVCHWRSNMSGVAWLDHPGRAIEAPHPKSPVSFSILAHEVGHQVLGKTRPRWREEHLAWQFALDAMEEFNVPITDAVQARHHESMRYALAKAMRRGLQRIPAELEQFLTEEEQKRLLGSRQPQEG